ncbi:hypothetical protein M0802_014845 [Mischocyttarus mexicanus]|nr:hypothetical protein M0802_014845 [Mischocyttarus mexicanus]
MSSRTSRAQRASPARSYAKVLNLAPQSSPRPVSKPQTSQQLAPSKQTSPQPANPQPSQQRAATPPASQGQSFIPDLSNNCCYCKRQHYLAFCPKFASLSRKERVEVVTEKRLCFNCLGRHNVRQCRSSRRCKTCGEPHHTLIHPGHLAISTKPKTSQGRSSSSSVISSATMSSQRLPSSSSTPSLSDALAHQRSRRRSQRKRSSHIQSSHSRSSSSSTPVASNSQPSFSPSSSHHKSSPPSSSHQKSSPPPSSQQKSSPLPSSHKTSHNPRSNLKTILKSSVSSSSRSSQKVKRVRFFSPISDCDRSSHSFLSSCSRALVLLATCKAFAISPKGVPTLIRLLIDPGSELTLASSKLVAKLNLKRHPGFIPIQGVGSSSPGATQGQVSLTLQSTYSSSQVNLKALILPKITSQVPSSAISEQDWPHLRPLRLADPDFLTPKSVDLLIGADNLRRIMKSSRLIMRGDSEPIAFHTRFGWAVLGATSSPRQPNSPISCHAISNESLNETLTKFWVQEEVSSCPTSSLSLAESECEKHFVDTHSRLPTAGSLSKRVTVISIRRLSLIAMAAKILLQKQRAASIADILNKTKDISAMDLATAERTRDFLEISWKKFDAENEKLYQASREPPLEHPYFKEKMYEATMQLYFSGLSILHRRIEALAPPASTTRKHEQARSRASLPMIELPKFSGSFTDWKPFEDLFSSLVRNDPDISSVEKMHYLRSSLEGEAARVISNLRLSADAFETAWKRLVGRFENKRLLALAHVERLLNLPPVKPRTSHGLHQLVNIIESSLSAIEAVGCPVEQWGLIVLQRASSALDAKTREDWEHHLGSSTEIPPYRRLLSFISAAARALEHIESHREHEKATSSRTSRAQRASSARSYAKVLNLAPQSSPRPVSKSQTSQQPAPSKQTSPQRAATPPASQGQSFIPDLSNNCCYCKRQHYLAFCPKFASLSRKERVEVVTEKRLCFNCLGRHNVRQCRSTRRCNTCGEPHHTLIHPGHLAISTKPKASQVRSSSSSIISSATIISEAAVIVEHALIIRCSGSSAVSSEVTSKKVISHSVISFSIILLIHSRSISFSTILFTVVISSKVISTAIISSKVISTAIISQVSSTIVISSFTLSHLKTILKSSISSSSKSSLSSSSRSSQKVKRVRFSSPISDCDRSSHSSLSSCSRAPELLATCKAFAISPKGVPTLIRLLIDPGSELTLASSKLVAKLNLKRHPGSIPIQGVGSSSPGATQGQVSLTLQSTYSSSQVNLKALILPKITSQVPSSVISEQDWPHLRPLRLADPDFLTPKSVDLLIGADNLRRIMKSSRLIMRGDSEPVAFHTRFSWAVLGATVSPRQSISPISCHAISNESLNETLTKFWVQEEVSSCPTSSLSLAESECEKHFVDTHSRLPTGRYVVRLPFSKDISALGHSKSLATKCLQRLLKRFGSDSLLKEKYTDFLREYESLEHMVPVPLDAPEPSHTFYLPHHGVWRDQSSSTKLRVVFNGSAKSSSHVTLNDLMHTGPKTQTDIFDVLLWIRQHKYIFITDVVKMFRQIQVHPQDRDLHRILWVNESSQIQAYQLTTVT